MVAQAGEAGQLMVQQARVAFVGGVGDAVLAAAVILVVAAVVVAVLAPARKAAAGTGRSLGSRSLAFSRVRSRLR
jgi:hypothetical protein